MQQGVLFVSKGIVHPSPAARRRLRALLAEEAVPGLVTGEGAVGTASATPPPGAAGRNDADLELPPFEVASRLDRLLDLDPRTTATVVLFFHEKTPPDGAVEALAQYVSNGGGLLAVHGAVASFKRHTAYAELIGGSFVGHDKPGPVLVYPAATERPGLRRGVADVTPIRLTDELYRVKVSGDVRVRYVGVSPGREEIVDEEPVCWERRHGGGRVAVVTLGHNAETFGVPAIRTLIAEELRRVAGVAGSMDLPGDER